MKKDVKEGYKKYEFGLIPNDWEVKKIGDIFEDLKCGATPSRAKIEYYNGNIPWITSGELKYKTIYKTFENITENAVKDTNLTIYPKGTFFIAITGLEADGTRGSCAISGIEATTNQSCLAFRPKIGFSNQYLYQWYRFYGDYIGLKYTQGTKQQSLNNKIVGNLEIPVPKLKEQEKIAEILSTVDEQIESIEKLIQKNKELKKGLMQQLLRKGIGNIEFKKTELGYIPKSWRVLKLKDLGKTYSGLANKSKENFGQGKAYIPYKNIFMNSKVDVNYLEYVEILDGENQNKVKVGDIFFTTSSETPEEAGMSSVLLNDIGELYLNSFCFGFRLNDFNTLNPKFAEYLLRDNLVRKYIYQRAQGSTRYNISKNTILDMKLPIPQIEEQEKIYSILSTLDQKIKQYQNKKEKLEILKTGLMQNLLKGKIRIYI
ncbi:restriction endonuclease subunit S [Clostridium perfringens]|uniref:restriction endonuclease subunit S n=1 Tax=Clostridium perfringens TaxID=1502 RepID=UPI0024BC7A85|nr:restriction endonuclease subunit S [Clostridium perfringens]